MVVFGLVGLGHRQPFSLNGLVLGCKVLIFLGHGNCCMDRSRLCRMLVIVPVELVDIAAARLVLLVCIEPARCVCCSHPPTLGAVDDCDPRGVGRAHVPVSPDEKKYELGADPFCGVVEI